MGSKQVISSTQMMKGKICLPLMEECLSLMLEEIRDQLTS